MVEAFSFFLRPGLALALAMGFVFLGFAAFFLVVLCVFLLFFFTSNFTYWSSSGLWGGLICDRLRRLYAMMGDWIVVRLEGGRNAPSFMHRQSLVFAG